MKYVCISSEALIATLTSVAYDTEHFSSRRVIVRETPPPRIPGGNSAIFARCCVNGLCGILLHCKPPCSCKQERDKVMADERVATC